MENGQLQIANEYIANMDASSTVAHKTLHKKIAVATGEKDNGLLWQPFTLFLPEPNPLLV